MDKEKLTQIIEQLDWVAGCLCWKGGISTDPHHFIRREDAGKEIVELVELLKLELSLHTEQ